jgi:hypothetical protein
MCNIFYFYFREFISDRHGSEAQNYYILKFFFFFLTNKSLDMSNSAVKSICQILLTSVTLFETHRLCLIKILIF